MSTSDVPTVPTGPATSPTPTGEDRLDLRRTPVSMGSVVSGYGLTPSAARQRAAVVRAVTDDSRIRQRPMPVVVVAGLVALGGLAVWGWQLWLAIDQNQPLSLLFWAALATFLGAAAICSWAWQLYDLQKAIVMWFAIAVLGLAAVLVLLLVLVALKGDSDLDVGFDLDGLLDKVSGSHAAHDPVGFAGNVALPLVEDAASAMGAIGSPAVDDGMAAGDGVTGGARWDAAACPSCGEPAAPGLLRCRNCGARVR